MPAISEIYDINTFRKKCKALSILPAPLWIGISLKERELALFQNDEPIKQWPVAISKNPISCEENSFGTPWGLHWICEKIGNNAPSGMVFRGRRPTKHFKEHSEEDQQKNLITTRILRLRGLEPGLNAGNTAEGTLCDTYKRMVYIHGTNHEEQVGTAASKGCIELTNDAIVDLYQNTPAGTLVWITRSGF